MSHENSNLLALREEFDEFKASVNATLAQLNAKVEKLQSTDEKRYQKLLEDRFKASHLHIPGVGITDITTADAHIEIKRWNRYHEVPGQLAKYQQAVPRDKLAVYFFGSLPAASKLASIRSMMVSFGINMHSIDQDNQIIAHEPPVHPPPPNDLDRWLRQRLQKAGGRLHVHRILDALQKEPPTGLGEIPADTAFTKLLKGKGYEISPKRVRDPICPCRNNAATLIGYDLVM